MGELVEAWPAAAGNSVVFDLTQFTTVGFSELIHPL